MNFSYIKKIPTKEEITIEIPISAELKAIKAKRDKELKKIFNKEDDRFIVVIGPCSADNENAVIDYTKRLSKLNEKLMDKLYVIPRVYTNKPRTNGEGYKGMLHQPDLDSEPNIVEGIKSVRKLHIKILEETGLTSADEMLYPDYYTYLEDILGYVVVGARSVENQQHRLVSSGVSIPVGMKNPISGDLNVMINSIKTAQQQHELMYNGWEIKTVGNGYSHAILRGYIDKKGECIPNYQSEDILNTIELYEKAKLKNKTIIIDVSHSNSNKDYRQQSRISKEVLQSIKSNKKIRKYVKGLMIESYIVEGKQHIDDNRTYGKSVTDGCIGWEETEQLLNYIAANI